jgi:branched-chain amino acid transport system ATP-binding protein
MLTVTDITVAYGPVLALNNVSLHVEAGEVVTLLGANGAGKTSLLRAISGLAPVLGGGRIRFDGRELTGVPAARIVGLGLAHCPEGRHVFPDLTVEENLDLGAYSHPEVAVKRENLARAFHYFPVLADRRRQKAGTLSGGEQQMLAMGRALMSSPKLLTLDEPSLGLAPMLVDQIFDIIRLINREQNTTVLLVEQNANEALLHADRGYVLENGRIAMEGAATDLSRNPRVIEAYLGV